MANFRIPQLIFCVLFAVTGINGKPPSAVVGGPDAFDNEFPYQVSLSVFGQALCGGTIIDSKHILTAAHCVDEKRFDLVEEMLVTTGTNNIENGEGNHYRVKKITKHPQYASGNQNSWRNDIAIITLNSEIRFNSREKAVKLPTSDTRPYVVATASGWGDTWHPNGQTPANLKKLDMQVIPNDICGLPVTGRALPTQLCAMNQKGSGLCTGDSGGPLVHDGVIVGVASFVIPCGLGYPDIFTRVYKYVDWINQVTASS